MSTPSSPAPSHDHEPSHDSSSDRAAPARAGLRLDEDVAATVVGLVLLLAVLVGLVPAGSVP